MGYQFEKNDKWLISQKNIEIRNINKFLKEREIWWVHTGLNIGNEIYGKGNDFKRPFLIIKKIGNMYIGFPITTKGEEQSGFFYKISSDLMSETSYIVKAQIKSFDKKRFIEKIGMLPKIEFEKIKKELQEYIFGNS